MLIHVAGLVKRGGVWQYRKTIPAKLRPVLGQREIIESLRTGDAVLAQARYLAVHARVERLLAEATAGASPNVAAYTAIKRHKLADPLSPSEIGLDLHLTSMLDPQWSGRVLTPTERAAVEGLLKRREAEQDTSDNPPLSIVFESYFAERNLPSKTVTEWKAVLRRFTVTLGADLPVRSITQAHVRGFKAALLAGKLSGKARLRDRRGTSGAALASRS